MVGPSVTEEDRKQFLKQVKIGFAVLVGGSMALVALWGSAALPLVVGIGVGTAVLGRVLAEYVFPDSIAEVPYDDDGNDRGPKPGTRLQERRENDGEQTRAADGDGKPPRRE